MVFKFVVLEYFAVDLVEGVFGGGGSFLHIVGLGSGVCVEGNGEGNKGREK